jgi:hypothetical protein
MIIQIIVYDHIIIMITFPKSEMEVETLNGSNHQCNPNMIRGFRQVKATRLIPKKTKKLRLLGGLYHLSFVFPFCLLILTKVKL